MRYRNAMQRDPNLAKAFDNLAGLFAPPSGSDFLASAKMQSERADAARREWLFNNSADPTASARSSLLGIQNYGQTPSGFDKSNATTIRGQDVDAATRLRQTEMQQSGDTTRKMLDPVAQGATRFVPPTIAQMYGVPGTQTGVVELKPGEQSVLPDGRTLTGPAKPPTMDEAKAGVFQQMPQDQQQAVVFGNTPIEAIIMGDKTVNTTRPGALGQSPVPPASAGGARKDGMALLPDGRRAPVTRAPDGLQWQMQDGTPVPPDAQVFDMARPTGTNDQLGITSSNLTAANKMQAAIDGADFTVRNMREILASNPNVAGVPGRVKGLLQSLASSAEQSFKAFAAENPNAPISLAEARDRLSRAAGGYDPNIVRLQSGIMDLAYARAQIANPSGEVSRQAFERALESFGQTYLSSQQDLETGLAAFEKDSLGAARVQLQSLRGNRGQPGAPAPAAATPPASAGAQGDPLAQAREAIARGAPREAVIQRLRQNGVDPGGL